MRPLYYAGIGTLAVLIVIILYFTYKTTPTGNCTGATVCTDAWIGSDGKPVTAQRLCDLSTLQVATPNYGPGQCASPCKPGETPCWDDATKTGHCVKGTGPCPCWGDADCGGPGRGKCVVTDPQTGAGYCACVPPWMGTSCDTTTCVKGKTCGPNGDCDATGKCKCKLGWASPAVGPPCSVCDDGWGPPGICTAKAFPNSLGVTLALTRNSTNCVNADVTDWATMNQMCVNEFGIGSRAADWCRHSGTSGNPCCSPSCGPNFCNTNLPTCHPPNGFWASPSFDYVHWLPCFDGTDCDAARPPGYAGTY